MRNVYGSKTFNKFQIFEGRQHFSPDLREKRQLTYKILKECRVAIANVVGLVDLSSIVQIIILRFRT